MSDADASTDTIPETDAPGAGFVRNTFGTVKSATAPPAAVVTGMPTAFALPFSSKTKRYAVWLSAKVPRLTEIEIEESDQLVGACTSRTVDALNVGALPRITRALE